jgi:hypothetical protein
VQFRPFSQQHRQVILGETKDSLPGLAELPDQAQVDGGELTALADEPGFQVLGIRLAWLVVGRGSARGRNWVSRSR